MLFIRFIIITLIILIGCKSSYNRTGPKKIMGCIEETACNYNEHATVNDGSCQTVDVCGECGGDVTTIEDCALPWKWNINYNISRTISGFQFNVEGVTITGVSGGAAEAAGFMLSNGETTVLGFSLQGATIPAGAGVLVVLDVTGDGDACLADLVISDSSGNDIPAVVDDCQKIVVNE